MRHPSALAALALLAALASSGPGARAGGGLDLSAVKSLVDAGAAGGGTAKVLHAYRGLQKILASPSTGLPGDLGRLKSVAGACAVPLVDDAGLRSAMSASLDAGDAAIKALDVALIGKAGDLQLQSHRDAVLARAARALNLEKTGTAKRIFGADAAAAGLFKRAAAGLAAGDRLAGKLLAAEIPKKNAWNVPVQGRGGALLGVWGEHGPDPRLYVVGAADADGPQFLVRPSGAEGWVRVPVADSGDLWWVTTVPGDAAAWACGSGGRVVRYDTASGEIADHSTGVNAVLYGLWGSGPSDIWAVGGDPLSVGPRPAILHWDGATWTLADVPPGVPGRILYKVWGAAADDVWAVGQEGVILHFDGSTWSLVPSGTIGYLIAVTGPSPVTAVGGGMTPVAIERQADGSWSTIPVPHFAPAPSGQVGAPVSSLGGVFIPQSGAALAVGGSATLDIRGPTGWTSVLGAPAEVKDLHSIWMDDAGNAVMVGGQLSTMTLGHVVTWGRNLLPSIVSKRARFRDGVADTIYLGCAHSGCHLAPFSNAGLSLDTPEVDLANLVNVGSTQSPLLRVFPGRPSQSYLWHKLLGDQTSVGGSGLRMPTLHLPGDAYWTDAQMELVRGWILDGARDN